MLAGVKSLTSKITTYDVLDIQVSFAELAVQALVVDSVVNEDLGEVLGRDAELLLVQEGVFVTGRLVQETAESDSAAGSGVGLVVANVVELTDARRCDRGGAWPGCSDIGYSDIGGRYLTLLSLGGLKSFRHERRSESLGFTEESGGSDDVDVFGDFLRNGVGQGSDLTNAVLLVVDEAGVEKGIGVLYGDLDCDDLAIRAQDCHALGLKPRQDGSLRDRWRVHKVQDVLLVVPLTVSLVLRVRDSVQFRYQAVEVLQLEVELQLEHGCTSGLADGGPSLC